jgi:hypothetical protein
MLPPRVACPLSLRRPPPGAESRRAFTRNHETRHLGADGNVSEPKKPADWHPDADADKLPAIDFSTFVLSLSHSALVHLGDAPLPDGQMAERDLMLARQTIDLLGILQEKTRNNLTGEEERLLDQALYDLRLRFVEISKSS